MSGYDGPTGVVILLADGARVEVGITGRWDLEEVQRIDRRRVENPAGGATIHGSNGHQITFAYADVVDVDWVGGAG